MEHPSEDEVRRGRVKEVWGTLLCVCVIVVVDVAARIVAVCKQLHLTDAVDHHKDKMAAPFHPDDVAK